MRAFARLRPLLPYASALLASSLGLTTQALLNSAVGGYLPAYVLSYPAVFFVSWQLGTGPGLFATAVTAVGATTFFLIPRGGFEAAVLGNAISVSVYLMIGAGLSIMLPRAQRRRIEEKLTPTMQALRESEEKYRTLFEKNFDAVFLTRPDGTVLAANPQACRLFGMTEKEICRTGRSGLIVQDEKLAAALIERSQTGQFSAELNYRRKDGSVSIADVCSMVFLDRDGTEKTCMVFRDIAERKKAERLLQESEARWRSLVENAPDIITTIDRDFRITFANRSKEPVFGDRSIGTSIFDRIKDQTPPEYQESVRQHFLDTFRTGETIRYEAPSRGDDQKIYWYSTVIGPIKNARGEVDGAILMSRDITARRATEEDIRRNKALLESIVQSTSDMVFVKDRDGKYLLFNAAAERFSSRKAGDVLGHDDSAVFPAEVAKTIMATDRKVMASGTIATFEELTHSADGTETTFLTTKGPLYDHEGRISGIFGIARDVTVLKKAEQEKAALIIREKAAHEASLLKSQFLANMSHEIRTPMNGVLGAATLLKTTQLTQEQAKLIELITNSGNLLLNIINDILDFSRIESGKLEAVHVPFDPAEEISSAVTLLSFNAKPKGVKLETILPAELPREVVGDPGKFRQILINLVGNAIKFTDVGTVTVRISVEERSADEGRMHIEVVDTGIGIPEQALPHLFQPFTQADSSSTRRHGGTGLGLSICKRLVELLRGEIGVTSREGSGSTFWFTLPFTIPGRKARPESKRTQSADAERTTKSARLLLAEDNEENQIVAASMLKVLGYAADIARDGEEVLEALRRTRYDLILMDCQMPKIDGYRLTSLIRSHEDPRIRSVRIVAMTSHAMKGDRERCIAAGMDDYVAKPIDFELLAATLERQLAVPAARVDTSHR